MAKPESDPMEVFLWGEGSSPQLVEIDGAEPQKSTLNRTNAAGATALRILLRALTRGAYGARR